MRIPAHPGFPTGDDWPDLQRPAAGLLPQPVIGNEHHHVGEIAYSRVPSAAQLNRPGGGRTPLAHCLNASR
jgi:hypothetical protein